MRVFPPFPAPVVDLDLSTKEFDPKILKNTAGKYYQDKSIEITANNHKTFVTENP